MNEAMRFFFLIDNILSLVPFLIFFTSTMFYPRLKGISNLQSGTCKHLKYDLLWNYVIFFFLLGDVQWNKNHVFNLCLTIGYFWTTLFVMIVLYIFIYGNSFLRFSFLSN
jgi:hypothetical protein